MKFVFILILKLSLCYIDNNMLGNTSKATVNVSHRIAGFDTINGYEIVHNIVVGYRQLSPAGTMFTAVLDSHLATRATGT